MILLIDNYDSFTYNVKQEIETLGFPCVVRRNDAITVEEIKRLGPSKIVISPGPGRPDDAGITLQLIAEMVGKIPLLGICLGHQAIGQVSGGKIIHAIKPMHGKISRIRHDGKRVFHQIPVQISVARYHSLVIDKSTLPAELEITAVSEEGEIMGVRNILRKQEGVQFHPESVATEHGRKMMENFLKRTDG